MPGIRGTAFRGPGVSCWPFGGAWARLFGPRLFVGCGGEQEEKPKREGEAHGQFARDGE